MRIKWIDTAKGIAMLCVFIGHMGGLTLAGVNLNLVYAFHLPVFFLLSGYTLKKKELTKEYINDKFKRLMIPYFWTCFCVLILDIVNQIIVADNASVRNITDVIARDLTRFFFASGTYTTFADIEIGSMIGAIWFLPAMFFATLIVQWVLNVTEKLHLRWCIMLSIAIVAYISSDFIWFPFSIQSGAFVATLILLGYYIREYDILSKINWKHCILFALIFIYAILSHNTRIYYVTNYYPDIVISMIISIASTLLVLKLTMLCQNSKYLNYVGNNSIYFLCVHLVALETLKPYFVKVLSFVGVPDEYQKWGILAGHIIFCTIVTWCILFVKSKLVKREKVRHEESEGRDNALYLLSGILVAAVIVGYGDISTNFREILYSFHIPAIVFVFGYFYKKSCNVYKTAIVILVSYAGMIFGKEGLWLPWNLDCVMYAIVFFVIGYYCRKYDVLKFIKENLILYFVFACIWVYMIYRGSMDIAMRQYEPYSLVILGAVSATILLYLLCSYIQDELPGWIVKIGTCLGENTLYILIVHILFGGKIHSLVGQIFDERYIYHMVMNVILQLLLGILLGRCISPIKNIKIFSKGVKT